MAHQQYHLLSKPLETLITILMCIIKTITNNGIIKFCYSYYLSLFFLIESKNGEVKPIDLDKQYWGRRAISVLSHHILNKIPGYLIARTKC